MNRNSCNCHAHNISGLYGITPDMTDTSVLLARTAQALAGGAQWIQYRNKTADAALRRHQAGSLVPLCREYGVPLIVNDHLDLALEIGACGIHVGEHDIDITAARKQLGAGKIIGVSCYNKPELAQKAQTHGADYVAFGAFYATVTKRNTVVATIAMLKQAKTLCTVPVVCIGGINAANALPLIEAGANAIAVSQALFQARNIRETAEEFSRLFSRAEIETQILN
ncbi:MAG: thiamine phosphate synthase [Nitrosomonas sp.]|nr:thiamine phosphate synthase [Nitrosomonas sp.]